MRSPDSPKNFPTWGTPKQSVSLQNQTKRPESVAGVSVSVKEEPVAGIDDSTQGGVSTLRNRFESSTSNAPAQHKSGRSRSSLPPRWSVSSQLSETLGELDDLYEYLSEDCVDVTNTNNQATNTNNSRHLQNSQSMIINSNTNNQSLLTVGRAQSFTNAPSQPTSDRRQRLPVQEDDLYDDTVIEQQQESGLNQSFKNKLEGLFGGSPAPAAQRPVSNKGTRELPATPINRQLSEDHEYQELPEIIPDAVTYVNDKFNVD